MSNYTMYSPRQACLEMKDAPNHFFSIFYAVGDYPRSRSTSRWVDGPENLGIPNDGDSLSNYRKTPLASWNKQPLRVVLVTGYVSPSTPDLQPWFSKWRFDMTPKSSRFTRIRIRMEVRDYYEQFVNILYGTSCSSMHPSFCLQSFTNDFFRPW